MWAISKRDWHGADNIPKTGPAIVASNHLSYSDVLFFAQFLYLNGRAPRYIGKRSVFDAPIIGRIITAAEQIPVDRQTGTGCPGARTCNRSSQSRPFDRNLS
ncbi:MAG: lysophospholipid acyltransferase family protein [Actinomycetota bacterium]